MSSITETSMPVPGDTSRTNRKRGARPTTLRAHGEPMIWLTGGALALSLAMISGLLVVVFLGGAPAFWPQAVTHCETQSGASYMGEVVEVERFVPEPELFESLPEEQADTLRSIASENDGALVRRQLRVGNFELSGEHFRWIRDDQVVETTQPPWALVIERLDWGRFYGTPKEFRIDGEVVATVPEDIWRELQANHDASRERFARRKSIEKYEIGAANAREESARIDRRKSELDHGVESTQYRNADERYRQIANAVETELATLSAETTRLREENSRYELVLETADGQEKSMRLAEIVRTYPANALSMTDKLTIYASRWWEFLSEAPRYQNSEGGVAPAIFGTVLMTLIMSIAVVPFGVLAALYLREYAKQGFIISAVRVAVNNLAGVPSIVFGVFGLGFFSYVIGGWFDETFFYAKLPSPTLGTGGLLWASLTLALLTLPVVIVATEEALAAVPGSMRAGSYACGATRWQTIRRIVLPRAAPGIMTGMILAIARGAGEVAPLMLVGAAKMAPEPLVDGIAPYLHPDRSFMHLGFHIYDLGFQSPNSEAAIPMVFTTTLLLIGIVIALNILAIWTRSHLRRKFQATSI